MGTAGCDGERIPAPARVPWVLAGTALLLCAWPSGAATQVGTAPPGGELSLRPPPGMASRSVGYVFEGSLRRPHRMRESQYVRYVGEYRGDGHFYGTWQLAQLVARAARRVAFRLPGAALSLGELSAARGGPLAGHRSHQNGRDVDIGFYMTWGPGGRPYHPDTFVEFDGRGRGRGRFRALLFDDARNWELVAKLVDDRDARVQYIFVAERLQRRLLAYGRAIRAPVATLERAATAMVQPRHGHPHANHFHVRVYCPAADRPACRDQAPFWAWYPGRIPGGLFASLERTRHVYE